MQSSATAATTQPDSAKTGLRAGTRRLILIRHAKAVEDNEGGDHGRGLSERGRADAQALAVWLKENRLTPDAVICSTATRTRQTLEAITHNVPTILSDKLYLASPHEMLAQIQATDDAVHTLMLVAHNPGSHALLGLVVGECEHEEDADRMALKFPTSACAVIDFPLSRWHDVTVMAGRLTLLRY